MQHRSGKREFPSPCKSASPALQACVDRRPITSLGGEEQCFECAPVGYKTLTKADGVVRTQSAGDNETGAGQGMGMRAPRCGQGPRRAMMKGRDQVGSGWDGRGAAILYISCESKKRRNFYFHDVILFSHTSGPVYYPISSMNELLSFLS